MRDEKRMMRREMLILSPPGSPAATVGAEVWEGRRPPPASPTCCVAGCCHFRPEGKIQGEASPLPLSCLLIFLLKLERRSKTFTTIKSPCLCLLVEGKRRSRRALGGRDVCGARPGLLCLQAPSMEGRMEHAGACCWGLQRPVPFCDRGVAEATRLGKAGSFLFFPGIVGDVSRVSGQGLGAMSHHTTLLEQGCSPRACPALRRRWADLKTDCLPLLKRWSSQRGRSQVLGYTF